MDKQTKSVQWNAKCEMQGSEIHKKLKKIKKLNKNDKCIQQHFKTKHLNEN